jgi:hypothetical protein
MISIGITNRDHGTFEADQTWLPTSTVLFVWNLQVQVYNGQISRKSKGAGPYMHTTTPVNIIKAGKFKLALCGSKSGRNWQMWAATRLPGAPDRRALPDDKHLPDALAVFNNWTWNVPALAARLGVRTPGLGII